MISSSHKPTKNLKKTKTNEPQSDMIAGSLEWLSDREEEDFLKLKPKNIESYIGQDRVKKQLSLMIESAKIREKLPEHILFYGQPGLGKTTLASLISKELKCQFKVIAAPSLSRVGDLVTLMMNLEPHTVLFIDEIHRLKAPLEESLYTAMEAFQIDLIMGKATTSKAIRVDIPPFTLVGATTQLGKISKPLKDRFGSVFQLEPYSPAEILELIDRNSKILKLKLSEEAKALLCRRCRGVPRITNNLLKRLRDFQLVQKIKELSKQNLLEFLSDMGVYDEGLTKADLLYLKSLQRGTAGVKTLSAILMEEVDTLESVTEPYLLYLGLVDKTQEGRKLTPKGNDYLQKHYKMV